MLSPTPNTRISQRPRFNVQLSNQATYGGNTVFTVQRGPLRQLAIIANLISPVGGLETQHMRHLTRWGVPGICASTLLHQMEGLRWKILNDQRQEDATSQYFTDLFRYANDGLGGANTLFTRLVDDVLASKAGGFIEIVRNWDRVPVALYSVDGNTMRHTANPSMPFVQEFNGEVAATFETIDMVHLTWRTYSDWQLVGYNLSPVQISYDALGILGLGDDYNRRVFREDIPLGILNLGENFDRKTALEWKTVWDAEINSNPAVNKFGIVWGTPRVDFHNFTPAPKDMAFSDTALWYAMLVTSAFELSPQDIGITASKVLAAAAAEQQVTLSRRRGLRTLRLKLSEAFERLILPPGYKFEFESIDSTDDRDQAAISQMRAQAVATLVQALGPAAVDEALAANLLTSRVSIDDARTWIEDARRMQRDQMEQQAQLQREQMQAQRQPRTTTETAQDINPTRDNGSRQPKGQKGRA